VGTDTNELKQGIERTRGELGRDVDALAEKVTPTRIAERRMQGVRDTASGIKDAVMGKAEQVSSSTTGTAEHLAEATRSTAGTVKQKAEGNPLATGLLAFAAGWLVSSLLPATAKEKELARAAQDKVRESGVLDEAGRMAGEIKAGMQEPLHESMEHVKEAAAEAAAAVKDDAQEHLPGGQRSPDHGTQGTAPGPMA